MCIVQDLLAHKMPVLMAVCVFFGLSEPILAGPRDSQSNEEAISHPAEGDVQDGAAQQALGGRISIEESIRLRRDLDEYSRSVDPAHVQIEERRRIMRKRIQERFSGSDKDSDGSISREEATEALPQIARHFSEVDLNGDGVITLDELEAAQARAIDHQRAATAKYEGQEPESSKRKSKDAVTSRKRAL